MGSKLRQSSESEVDFAGRSKSEVVSFVQAWLYLGLLNDFLGQPVDKRTGSDFICGYCGTDVHFFGFQSRRMLPTIDVVES